MGTRGRKRQIGIMEAGKFNARDADNKFTPEFAAWNGMLQRCYDPKMHARAPTYAFCSMSETFYRFQTFAEWCHNQVGFGLPGGQLDKDLLVRGNQIYSEETCVFLPRPVNMLLCNAGKSRGKYPIGVSMHSTTGKLRAQLGTGTAGKIRVLGYFDTPEAAFQAYRAAKETFIRQRATEYREVLDKRAYEALMTFTININD